jgi:hypothetical protein
VIGCNSYSGADTGQPGASSRGPLPRLTSETSFGAIPAGAGYVGLLVTLIGAEVVAPWAAGTLDDQHSFGQWGTSAIARE